jgi:hypothetical protein
MGYGGIYSLTCPWAIPLLDEDVHPVPWKISLFNCLLKSILSHMTRYQGT